MAGIVTAAAVVSAGALAYSAYEQREARQDQRQANRRARRIEEVKAQRQRTQAIRQNRVNAASVFAQAANSGQQNASATQSTLAGLGTNAAINQQYTQALNSLNVDRMRSLSRAEDHLNTAGIAEQGAQIANTVGGAFG